MAVRRRAECLMLAFVVTLASHGVPYWLHVLTFPLVQDGLSHYHGYSLHRAYWDALSLLFGLCLVAPDPGRFGLRIGEIDMYWRRVLLLTGGTIAVGFIGCSLLTLPLWMGDWVGFWLISPFAQDLVFVGFLYTFIEESFPGYIHPSVPINRSLVITAGFFSFWHVPNFLYTPGLYTWFQLGYTFLGALCIGLTRQWTGSMLYATIAHTSGNFFAWYFVNYGSPWGNAGDLLF
jgi:membrane protease YdiL (CAAX protease family)